MAAELLVSEAATQSEASHRTHMLVLDIKRAFLYGQARRTIFVRLPPEDIQSQGGGGGTLAGCDDPCMAPGTLRPYGRMNCAVLWSLWNSMPVDHIREFCSRRKGDKADSSRR